MFLCEGITQECIKQGGQKRVQDPLEVDLQVVLSQLSAMNQTQVLCKNGTQLRTAAPSLHPCCIDFFS